MPNEPVVANNTPLVAFWLLDRLDLLRDLYGKVLIPRAVSTEFLAVETREREAALAEAPWIEVVDLEQPKRALAYIGLDRGEAELLALAEERRAKLVLIDERRGRRYASRLGLTLSGTLGVLLAAKKRGLIASIADPIRLLDESGLYLGRGLVEKVLQLAGEVPADADG